MIVPAEIRALPRIVAWVYERRGGRRTKVPVQAVDPERRAAVDRPATWATWEAAMAAYRAGRVDGPGVVLGDGLVGVDLDHCRDPKTGKADPAAVRIVRLLDSYTEVSPSGTGVHVLLRGALPPGGRRKGMVEMYADGRFFTLTGRHVTWAPTTVNERTAALAQVHREVFGTGVRVVPGPPPRAAGPVVPEGDVVTRARAAKNGAKFSALWDATDGTHGSRSEGDLALCGILAWWCDYDPARVDALFRQSGRMRPKWDQSAGAGRTYGERTVALACIRGTR